MIAAPVNPFAPTRQAPPGWTYLDYPGADILLQATTKWEKGFRAEACNKEPWTVAWIESMTSGSVFWNVGANVGSYALIAASRGIPTVAIEPGYASYAALCQNVVANRLEGRITPLCVAIGTEASIIPLAYRSLEAGAASHAFGSIGVAKSVATLPTLTVAIDTLDTMCRMIGAPSPTHLLVDVDGAELLVLQGAATALRTSVTSIMIEVQPILSESIGNLLASWGYQERQRFTQRNGKPLGDLWYALWERGET